MGVSKNRGTPKSSILIGFSIINHPFWGTSIFGNTHIYSQKNTWSKQLGRSLSPTWMILVVIDDLQSNPREESMIPPEESGNNKTRVFLVPDGRMVLWHQNVNTDHSDWKFGTKKTCRCSWFPRYKSGVKRPMFAFFGRIRIPLVAEKKNTSAWRTWICLASMLEKKLLKLVGGWTNPAEKYESNLGIFPQIGVKMKNIWNHHLDILA